MYTAYLLILTTFSGAGEIIDPDPHANLKSCKAELEAMKEVVERDWALHGILRLKGDCRPTDSFGNAIIKSDIDL